MIVIDGDSVALATTQGVYAHQTWWARLNDKAIVLATPSATTAEILARVPQVIDSAPGAYILCVGQWAHNHEPIDTFRDNVREICRKVMNASIRVTLVTPPPQQGKYEDVGIYAEVVRQIAAEYADIGVKLLDFYAILKDYDIYAADKIHLGAAGNAILADHLNNILGQ